MNCPPDYYELNDGAGGAVFVPDADDDDRHYYCPCGGHTFEVFSPLAYFTNTRCTSCGRETTVHSG